MGWSASGSAYRFGRPEIGGEPEAFEDGAEAGVAIVVGEMVGHEEEEVGLGGGGGGVGSERAGENAEEGNREGQLA